MTRSAYIGRLRTQVTDNRRALHRVRTHIRSDRVDWVVKLQREFIRRAQATLGARGACVVEGHGDLRAEHVCLEQPVTIIDCLEFSRDLRLADPAEEMAFLSLEVERQGRRELAARLLCDLCVVGHAPASEAILEFYRSHRATVRAKLAAWHLDDPEFPDSRPWTRRANSYLADAQRHAVAALRLLREDTSGAVRGGPALQDGRERRARAHAL
jgi:aminoglycoside phosphotransferase family enzyme